MHFPLKLIGRRMLAQPFSIAFWSMGFPLAAFASLSLRLAVQHPGAQAPAMIALALASLVGVTAILAATMWLSLKIPPKHEAA